MMNRNGYTLMEILITLGIIGVVTAVTIPSLVSSTNKKNIGNALARSVELIQQGFTNIQNGKEKILFNNPNLLSKC